MTAPKFQLAILCLVSVVGSRLARGDELLDERQTLALQSFPAVPPSVDGRCVLKINPLTNEPIRVCGPGFVYYYETGNEEPYALSFMFGNEDITPTKCTGYVKAALRKADFVGTKKSQVPNMKVTWFRRDGLLFKASWVVVQTKQCHVSVCRPEVGKGPMGVPCRVPDDAKRTR